MRVELVRAPVFKAMLKHASHVRLNDEIVAVCEAYSESHDIHRSAAYKDMFPHASVTQFFQRGAECVNLVKLHDREYVIHLHHQKQNIT